MMEKTSQKVISQDVKRDFIYCFTDTEILGTREPGLNFVSRIIDVCRE